MPRFIPSLLLVLAFAAQQQVFRSGTELVEVDVVVLDRDGQLVRGLTAGDFELYDEGKLQDISTFSFIDVPPAAPDAVSEIGLASSEAHRRAAVYLIVIDYLHTPSRLAGRVRERAREFVRDHMGPSDLAAVVHLGLSTGGVEFSSSKPALIAAIDRVKGSGDAIGSNPMPGLAESEAGGGGGKTSVRTGNDEVYNLEGAEAFERMMTAERAEKAYEMLALAVEYVSGFTGRRKSMLLFSSGIPINMLEMNSPVQSKREQATRFVLAHQGLAAIARQSSISVYAIDAQGLDSPGNRAGSQADVAYAAPGTLEITVRPQMESLRTLAHETGGRAILNYNALGTPFGQIARDNGSYYLLGFRPASTDLSRFRALNVRVKREGLQVFARQGYGGDKKGRNAKMSASLARAWAGKTVPDLLDRPLPGAAAGLPLRASASIIGRVGAKARVMLMVEIDGGTLAADATQLEVGYRAIDQAGKVAANRVDVTRLQVSERTRAAIDRSGWRYLTAIELSPGTYQVRIAARETKSEGAGVVFLDVDVPDPSRQPLAIESVLVGSTLSGATPTAAAPADLLKAWPSPPTARRTFDRSETITAFIRTAGKEAGAGELLIEITGEDGRKMMSAKRPLGTDALAPDAAPISMSIAMAPFEPGAYVMIVSVSGSSAGAPVATHSVPFTVRPPG